MQLIKPLFRFRRKHSGITGTKLQAGRSSSSLPSDRPPGRGFGLRDGAQVAQTAEGATESEQQGLMGRLPRLGAPPRHLGPLHLLPFAPPSSATPALLSPQRNGPTSGGERERASSTWSLPAAHLLPPHAHCVSGLLEGPHSAATNGDVSL